MARQKYTHRLPELRVSQELFDALHQVETDSGTNLTDVMRHALEAFVKPDIPEDEGITIPISGHLSSKGIVFDKLPSFSLQEGQKVRANYLDVEPVGWAMLYKVFIKGEKPKTMSKEALMSWLAAQLLNGKVLNITVEQEQPKGITIIKRKGGWGKRIWQGLS